MTGPPWFGLSLMLEDDWRLAALPLFEAGDVDVLEWSFDATPASPPAWAAALLDAFSHEDRLLGHGVSYSPLSARWEPRQDRYLARLERELATRKHRHVSEHLGFSTAGRFVDGPPLPQPWTKGTLGVARDRLARLARVTTAAGVPVGLENLALVTSPTDALDQAAFLGQLLAPLPGTAPFLLLDLHNLWVQSCNTGLPPETLLEALPLRQTRELHISGGSWSSPRCRPEPPFRRDTHDGAVPEPVLNLLPVALDRCPGVEAVIFERIGGSLQSPAEAHRFREDAARIRELVTAHTASAPAASVAPTAPVVLPGAGDDEALAAFQAALLAFLHAAHDPQDALARRLEDEPALAPFADYLRGLEAPALEVASDLVRRWGVQRPDEGAPTTPPRP